jgi:hypothetical protein
MQRRRGRGGQGTPAMSSRLTLRHAGARLRVAPHRGARAAEQGLARARRATNRGTGYRAPVRPSSECRRESSVRASGGVRWSSLGRLRGVHRRGRPGRSSRGCVSSGWTNRSSTPTSSRRRHARRGRNAVMSKRRVGAPAAACAAIVVDLRSAVGPPAAPATRGGHFGRDSRGVERTAGPDPCRSHVAVRCD